ncbi:hypothetical protein DAEQUDRAFT_727407 [Daedalea quercina L-15889]|uniref:F-box domain-containing protein n=1 Tax=Daedalea quercina L-15889 TaxID=1314783 RepID=A0A165PY13_9APHY|nr:hypothetical protein DAEQUDRAFT_727407 [Daedalea quercina L-15889]
MHEEDTILAYGIDDISLLQLAELLRARLAREVSSMSHCQVQEVVTSFSLALLEAQKTLDVTRRLPTEILHMIFQLVPGFPLVDHGEEDSLDGPAGCLRDCQLINISDVIPLTHVCRRWREVATNMPELWTTIDDRNRTPYEYYVERSQALPLQFLIDGNPRANHIPEWLREHASAIQGFHWFGILLTEALQYGPCRALLEPFLPNLHVATLQGLDVEPGSPQVDLFGGTTSLRQLCMHSLNWLPTNYLPNLTRLHIVEWESPCDVSRLLSFLRQCPNLVDISFTNLFTDNPILASQDDVVGLPRLRRLIFDDFVSCVSDCLPHILARPETALCVRTREDPLEIGDIRAISHFSNVRSYTRLWIKIHKNLVYVMAVLSQISGVYVEDQGGNTVTGLSETVARLVSLHRIEELWLIEERDCNATLATLFQGMLGPMRALRKLVVTIRGLRDVTNALLSLQDDGPPIHEFTILINSRPKDGNTLLGESIQTLRGMGIPPQYHASGTLHGHPRIRQEYARY